MLVLDTLRFACDTCIRGHRSSQCAHRDRDLLELRKKGRPRLAVCNECRRRPTNKASSSYSNKQDPCPHVATSNQHQQQQETATLTLPTGQKLTLISHQSADTVRDLLARGVQFVITTGAGAGNSAKSKKKSSAAAPAASSSLLTSSSSSSLSSPASTSNLNALDATSHSATTELAPVPRVADAPAVAAVTSLSSLLNPCNCQERTGRRCLCCDISDDADPVPCDSADCSCAHSVLGSLHLLPLLVSNAQPSAPSRGGCCGSVSRTSGTNAPLVTPPTTTSPPFQSPALVSSCCAPQPQPAAVTSSSYSFCASRQPAQVQPRSSCCASPPPLQAPASSCCSSSPPQQQQPTKSSCCNASSRAGNSIDMLIAAANYTPSTSAAATWTSLPLPNAPTTVSTTPPAMTTDFPFLFPPTTTATTTSPPPPASALDPLLFGSSSTLAPIRSAADPSSSSSSALASCIPLPTVTTPGPQCSPLHPVADTQTLPTCCQPSSTFSGPACCGPDAASTCTCCLPAVSPPAPPTLVHPTLATSCCCTSAGGCTAGPKGCECTGTSACGGECCARAKTRKRDRREANNEAAAADDGEAEGERVRKVQVNAQRRAMCTCGCVRPAVECGDCSRDLCVDFLLKDL